MLTGDVRTRRDPDARRHTARVHIHTRTPRIEDFHQAPPGYKTSAWSPQKRSQKDALTGRAQGGATAALLTS